MKPEGYREIDTGWIGDGGSAGIGDGGSGCITGDGGTTI